MVQQQSASVFSQLKIDHLKKYLYICKNMLKILSQGK